MGVGARPGGGSAVEALGRLLLVEGPCWVWLVGGEWLGIALVWCGWMVLVCGGGWEEVGNNVVVGRMPIQSS